MNYPGSLSDKTAIQLVSGQTSVFLGKWQLQIGAHWDDPYFLCFAGSTTASGSKLHIAAIDADCFCLWLPRSDGPPPPSSTIITLLTRLSDNALVFRVDTGEYVGLESGYLKLVKDLSAAEAFEIVSDTDPWDPNAPGTDAGGIFVDFMGTIASAADSNSQITHSDAALILGTGHGAIITRLVPSTQMILSKKNGDGLDLSGVDFTGIDFSGCSLKGTDFSGCNLTSAVLKGIDLTQTDFSGATLTNTHLAGAIMHGTKFDGTDLTSTDFGADPDFRVPVLGPPTATNPRTSFVGATLPVTAIGLDWTMLDLTNTELTKVGDLSGLNAQYALLAGTGLGLTGATLTGANFSHADLAVDFSNAHFSETTSEPIATFEGATLRNASFSGAKLVGANFKNIQGSRTDTTLGANFSSAYLVNAVLTEAQLVGISFAGAQLYGTALLDHANLQEADFSNSILAGLNLNEAHLRGAIFDGAILINASLMAVDLTPTIEGNRTSFTRANLIGTDFRGAQLASANLDSAVVALDLGVPFFTLTDLANWVPDLDKNQLSAALRQVFLDRGRPLRGSAEAYAVTQGSEWAIEQYPTYDVTLDPNLGQLSVAISSVVLFTMASSAEIVHALDAKTLPQELDKAIESRGTELASSAKIEVVTAGSAWSLTQIPSPENAIGYSSLTLSGVGGNLTAFGSELMVKRLGPHNKEQLEIVDVLPTKLTADELGPNTQCPNQAYYSENVAQKVSWTEMMTATSPATPPVCVPSPDRWCKPGTFSS